MKYKCESSRAPTTTVYVIPPPPPIPFMIFHLHVSVLFRGTHAPTNTLYRYAATYCIHTVSGCAYEDP